MTVVLINEQEAVGRGAKAEAFSTVEGGAKFRDGDDWGQQTSRPVPTEEEPPPERGDR